MISILDTPYQALTAPYNPVYNGLPFVVSSDMRFKESFRYIAEIYVGSKAPGVKIGELRHSPDISNNSYGFFDAGRVLEDYITYSLAWDLKGMRDITNAFKTYWLEFGEEHSRTLKVLSARNSGGKLHLVFSSGHDMEAGASSILLQGTSDAQANTYHKVISIPGPNDAVIDYPYVAFSNLSDAYAIQGTYQGYLDTYRGADGNLYYKFSNSGSGYDQAFADSGSSFQIYPADPGNSWLEGSYRILDKQRDENIQADVYFTNIPYVKSMLADGAYIFPQSNISKKKLISTANAKANAFSAVFQYEDAKFWDPRPYSFYAGNTSRKFLTYRPRIPQGGALFSLCPTDYFSLAFLGQNKMPFPAAVNPWSRFNFSGILIESFLKVPASPRSTTGPGNHIQASSAGIPYISTYTEIKIAGDFTSQLTRGSYISVSGFTLSGGSWATLQLSGLRIMHSRYDNVSGHTRITISALYNPIFQSDSAHQWTITPILSVIIRELNMNLNDLNPPKALSSRWEVGCGPKNLALNGYSEFITNSVATYTISPWALNPNLQQNSNPPNPLNSCYLGYVQAGEKFTISISDCPCDSSYTPYTLFWMNPLGGWDYFTFEARTDKSRKIQSRGQFRRSLKTLGSYSLGERGKTTFSTSSVEEWTVNTGWLDQDTIDWLSSIFESPEVYMIEKSRTSEFGTNDIVIPIDVIDTELELKDKRNRSEDLATLYQMRLSFAKSNSREVQRGSSFGGIFYYNRS